MNAKASLSALIVALAVFPIASALAWHPYDDVYEEDFFGAQSPPVNESVKVAGFKLTVDETQLGCAVYNQPVGDVLARLRGDDVDVRVTRGKSIDQAIAQSKESNGEVVKVTPVKTRYGVKGYRVTYGGKPNMFSNHITEMRYYFVNPSGETICFAAHANKKEPDWDYFKYLMTEMIEPARA
jgi:hypothetical protein